MEILGIISKAISALATKLRGEPTVRAGDGSGVAVVSGVANNPQVNIINNYGAPAVVSVPPKWRLEERGYLSTDQEVSFVLKNVGGPVSSIHIDSAVDGLITECGSIGSDGAHHFKFKWPGKPLPTALHWTISWRDRAGEAHGCDATGIRTQSKFTFTTSP